MVTRCVFVVLGSLLAVILSALAPASSYAEVPAPGIVTPVTDLAEVLAPKEESRLSQMLVHLRKETGVQMAVLLVKTTQGEPIEDFSLRVAEQWGGGRRSATTAFSSRSPSTTGALVWRWATASRRPSRMLERGGSSTAERVI